jgi:hypothetical protein
MGRTPQGSRLWRIIIDWTVRLWCRCWTVLQLDQFQANCCVANILGPVRYSVSIQNFTRLKFCFGDGAVGSMHADLASSDHIDNVCGM